jgi:predicted nucleotidyltransferase component of viral defense system
MQDIARLPEKDRMNLFRETGQRMQIHESIVEKDFWVCWVLDYLFHDNQWKDKLIFKGGTSLSKAYGAIQRFSEDVDLVLDWTLLECTEEEAFRDRSGRKQTEFGVAVSEKTVQFLQSDFTPVLQKELSNRLGTAVVTLQDRQVVRIEYPRSFSTGYIRPEIILEVGPKALHEPNELVEIQPYAAEKFPNQFKQANTQVRTVSAERTFWEKATILHQEAHRTAGKKLPIRYSRHYYDLYKLSKTNVLQRALERPELLEDVAEFKMKFFRCAWAKYEDAKPGTLRLLPPEHNVKDLRKDYESMKAMLFGTVPRFEEIIEALGSLEEEINNGSNNRR